MPDWYDEVEPPRWRAEKGFSYFYSNRWFNVERDTDLHTNWDTSLYNSGNYWQTKEQAAEYARRCKAFALEYHKEIGI